MGARCRHPRPRRRPGPTPAPGELALSDVRIVLKPSKADPGTGLVQVEATLPNVPDFDPSSGPVSFDLSYGQSATWTEDLPETCGTQSCLKANARSTVYRWTNGTNGSKVTLSFVLGPTDRWKVRYTGRKETLGALAAGAGGPRPDGRRPRVHGLGRRGPHSAGHAGPLSGARAVHAGNGPEDKPVPGVTLDTL